MTPEERAKREALIVTGVWVVCTLLLGITLFWPR